MSDSFGARLRQQRERQQIALAFIADETKISLSLLEALERDDLTHWPTGIFRRGFIRDYARVVGLDCDAVVREFLERYPDPIEDITPASLRSEDGNTRAPTRLRDLVGSAVDAFRRLHIGHDRGPGEDTGANSQSRVENAAPAEKAVAADSGVSGRAPVTETSRAVPSTRWQTLTGQVAGDGRHQLRRHGATPDVKPAAPVHERPLTTSSGPGAIRDQAPAPAPEADLLAVAQLCTDLGRIVETSELDQLLARAAAILGAAGIIIWVFDPRVSGLIPAFVHGYADDRRTRLPTVHPEADNATAASFRSAQARIVAGSDQANGAVVVPLMAPAGCRGVLAVELPHGREQTPSVLALATIFAAQLATLVGAASVVEAVNL